LESELGNDAVYSPFADREMTLSEFLSNDLGAGLRIQESVTDDLTDEFLGAPVVAFGASFGAEESLAAFLKEKSSELEVTLTAIAEFGGGMVNAFRAAFAVNEHRDFTRDFVVFGDGQGPDCALDALPEKFEGNHGDLHRQMPQLVYLNMAQYAKGKQGESAMLAGKSNGLLRREERCVRCLCHI
jgi:hypothetical protein